MTIWKVVLLVSLALFALLTCITAVRGASDIRKLFERLEKERQDSK